jgi:hypothetical protein
VLTPEFEQLSRKRDGIRVNVMIECAIHEKRAKQQKCTAAINDKWDVMKTAFVSKECPGTKAFYILYPNIEVRPNKGFLAF